MEYVGETVNHYYSLKDRIGQGAFSCVFLGYHKVTGEKRALKVPKRTGIQKATQRETEALLSLKHKNIVQLYGIEDEMVSNKTVIVMEYCSGGSLQTMLQEPEYMNGLPDILFTLLLSHLAAGLKELHSKDFVHRDIKPANILITKAVPNIIVFKISDFGSSRQNHSSFDEEMCLSLAGTEEYLHPLLYKGAFIQKSSHVKVNSCVDKWALGVTLFHAATGDVPFKPHGGARRNRQTMFLMISQKPRGKICGVQEAENGKIQWSCEFPTSCNLSSGLKSRLVRIMSGLMEGDNTYQWSYETFFQDVDRIASSIPIFILNTSCLQYLTIYFNPNERVSMLYEMIATETDIDRRFQKIYFDNKNVDDIITHDTTVRELPRTSAENPLLLISMVDVDIFNNQRIYNDISTLDNAILRNEAIIKVGRKAATIIANLYVTVQEIHQTIHSINKFLINARKHNESKLREKKDEFHLLSMIAEERISRLSLPISPMPSIQVDTPLRARGTKNSILPQSTLQVREVTDYIRRKIWEAENYSTKNVKLIQQPKTDQSLCSDACVVVLKGCLQAAKDTLADIIKYAAIREKTPLDSMRNKHLRDTILSLVYKARNHWVTHCDCDKKTFLNNIQESLREELVISEKLRGLADNIEELKELISNPSTDESTRDNNKLSISCSEDMQSLFKESTKLETDGLICSNKESLDRFLKESEDFETFLDSMNIQDT